MNERQNSKGRSRGKKNKAESERGREGGEEGGRCEHWGGSRTTVPSKVLKIIMSKAKKHEHDEEPVDLLRHW